LAAIRDGRSVDTTMGFTPLDGLMMGTRSGSLDPGILTYLARHFQLTPDQLDEIVNLKSGLLGISGIAADMRQILAARAAGHGRATLAFDIYVHRLRAGIGAMVATLGGLDGLIFTAGVGEHAPEVRSAACAGLSYLGVALDEAKNAQSPPDQDVSQIGSRMPILIVRAEEDWMIARACCKLVRAAEATGPRAAQA
jgi:acetate kinase